VTVIQNATPILSAIGAQTITEDGTLELTLIATDAENDNLTFEAESSQNITASVSGTTLTITPKANFNGSEDITVKVDDGYTEDSEVVTVTVTNQNDETTGDVTITGTATEDETLTADTSAITDEDGIGTFTYQWKAAGTDITGATSSTYVLTQAEVGKVITVEVVHTDALGTTEPAKTSEETSAVVNVNDETTGDVTITGNSNRR
jgi:hypothetical protein